MLKFFLLLCGCVMSKFTQALKPQLKQEQAFLRMNFFVMYWNEIWYHSQMIFCVIVLCIRLFILHGVERNANGHEVAFFKWSPGNLFISCDYLLWIQLENSKCIYHYTILFGAIYRHDFNFLWMTIDNSKSSLNRVWNMIRFLLNQNWNCSRHSSCCFKYIWTVPKT